MTGLVQAWHVYLIAFLFGTGTAFDAPARQAFVNEMVGRDQLANAVGLNSASFNLARMIGPALAGILIAWMGSGVGATGWVILLNAGSYIAVIGSLARMRPSELTPTTPLGRGPGQLREGLRYVRSRPDLMLVMAIVFCVGTFGLNFQMTTALMATDVYGKGAGEYGVLGSILAIGSLAGSLLAARRVQPRQRLVIGAAIAFGLVEMVAGLMPTYLTFALILPLCGFAALTVVTAANALVQMTTAPEMRGRVMALYMAIFMGGTPFGSPLLGWIAEHAGARWTLIGGGALTVLGTLVATAVLAPRQGADDPPAQPWCRRSGRAPLPYADVCGAEDAPVRRSPCPLEWSTSRSPSTTATGLGRSTATCSTGASRRCPSSTTRSCRPDRPTTRACRRNRGTSAAG